MSDKFHPNPAGVNSPSREVERPYGAEPLFSHPSDRNAGDEQIDLRSVSAALFRNRYIILGTIALSLLLGLGATLLMTPIYEATATLQIEQQEQQVLPGEPTEMVAPIQDTERFLQTQIEVIESRYLAQRVAEDLGLYNSDEFLNAMNVELEPEVAGTAPANRRGLVLDVLQGNLETSIPRDSRIADVSFQSPDPVWAAKLANGYAENAITANLQRKFDRSSYARDFLQDQLASAKQRLEESERQAIGYARNAELIELNNPEQEDGGGGNLTNASLIQLNRALSAAVADRIEAQERWESARDVPASQLPQVLSNPAIQTLTQQRATVSAEYQQLLTRFKEEYPAVKRAAAQLAELDDQIQSLAGNIKSSIQQEYRIAAQQEQALESRISQLRQGSLAEQERSVGYNILMREADTNRQMYDGLLQRFKEVSAEAGIAANNLSLLDSAEVPSSPVHPRLLLITALAGFTGLLLGLFIIFIREQVNDSIRSPEDAEQKLGLPALSVIPVSDSPLEDLDDPKSAISEAYFALCTSIELAGASGLPRSILFTSSQAGEGKSTTAYAVARGFASTGRRVVLIDGDIRRPTVHPKFDLNNESGLSHLLANSRQLDEVVHTQIFPNLDVITAGPQPPNPAQLLGAEKAGVLIDQLSGLYDVVVIDAPPIMGLADAPLLSSHAEATVLAVETGRVHRGQAKNAIKRLRAAHARIAGIVLTRFETERFGYGEYGYGYGYETDKDTKG